MIRQLNYLLVQINRWVPYWLDRYALRGSRFELAIACNQRRRLTTIDICKEFVTQWV
jgi:hypothetical protein